MFEKEAVALSGGNEGAGSGVVAKRVGGIGHGSSIGMGNDRCKDCRATNGGTRYTAAKR
jgi:hypothetical protein